MLRRAALAVVALLSASPALAGFCTPDPDGLRCADGIGPLLLRGIAVPDRADGSRIILQGDGRGASFGMIGTEKLIIIRSEDMTAVKLGNRRLICVQGAQGLTVCK